MPNFCTHSQSDYTANKDAYCHELTLKRLACMCIHLLLHPSTTLASVPYKCPDSMRLVGKCETLLVFTSGYLDVLQMHLLADLC